MSAVTKMRQAGFITAISAAGGLLVEPASRLTTEQRAYICAHKTLLIEELRAEAANRTAPVADQVCCADCRHGQRIPDSDTHSWRLCNAGHDGGFGYALHRCVEYAPCCAGYWQRKPNKTY